METVGSTRLGRASSRYGAPAVFSGPVRKWQKKWVHVSSSSVPNNSNNNGNNNNASSRLLLRRWTPITAPSDETKDGSGDVSDEPPRRKFRYTPIAVLEEQKKAVVEKVEHEPTTESGQLTPRPTDETHEVHGKLDMNEISEDTKDSNMSNLDFGFALQGSKTGENSQKNSDDNLENKYPEDGSMN